ncbi:M12 family metallo-peptidase [Chryseobacterium sp. Ch-15]|uniref:M12 family metallo-peptidase n=1 Tax=Chryseobacterium muglaense TaxID=2893752 RepID=A0A9Q3UXE5_9FLAO|nr:zinc-dependent metalloprotease family protein [Chryseobacterium muglaense]MBD3904590.1 T9SS type A sorting domain-containing protein [Chryseobacterium muglaense]MCC9035696.1 M12 family metallo-peptidase [Chryseobacterium muglaense]MCM2555122.1 M12 family metallo-peptidase [Chryseobacterium muglaense]
MKKLITTLMVTLVGGGAVFAQWTPTSSKNVEPKKKGSGFVVKSTSIRDGDYYKLDLSLLQSQLKNAQETGVNAKPVEILLPTSNGKIERFAVYSFPVVVKELADQYQLGSYVGVGIDDPSKSLRFSLAPNDFQSMIMKSGTYEFIDAQNTDKTVYAVHLKTIKGKEGFVCSSEESPQAKQQMEQLYQQGKSFYNQPTDFSKLSDKKYRTMRLVMSVTGEYSQFFGGTVAGALAQINATLTRVNFVFEKDFALHLNLQNYPQLIYLDPTTDPYATVTNAYQPPSSWNQALQTAITNAAGNANYDIGHLFGASGGGGNAGCIGCICVNPTATVPLGKGAAITSPLTGSVNPNPLAPPSGDTFDIDFVAHEMGHQLSATHSFSHEIQGGGAQMEPGSGSTIMGYAGITGGPITDIQQNSDAYFHAVNIKQVQANLISKTCDVETTVTNNAPVIAALPTFNIPKGTAFVLTASATDPENDPLTYTWEEMDLASVAIDKNNLGNTSTGASFRSLTPTTNPTRYFPKFTSVLNGVLDNSNNQWESVSKVARTTKFSVTVRDNNPNPLQQQTQFAEQTIIVGDNGPFKVTTTVAEANGSPTSISWAVANTTAAPYNVANVKIDYTTDNGTTWTVLSASTPNDGSESFTFPTSLNGSTVKVRISSIGNVFYAIGSVALATLSPCSTTAPSGLTVIPSLSGASIYWTPYSGTSTTYIVRYKKTTDITWTEVSTSGSAINVTGLTAGTYEAQVAAVCAGTTGTFSASVNFTVTTFSTVTYCDSSTGSAVEEHISSVSLANVNNPSGPSTYTNYTANPSLQINLVKGAAPYTLTVSVGAADAYDAASVWIDWNRNGLFEDSEKVLDAPVSPTIPTQYTSSVTVPSTAVENQPLRMRVVYIYAGSGNNGFPIPSEFACGTNFNYGETEDYNVVVTPDPLLSTNDNSGVKNNGIQIYPNPATDFLNVTKVSDKATYKIYSAAGQLVGNGNISNGKINVSSLIKGAYVISIEDKGKESFNSKFIKK